MRGMLPKGTRQTGGRNHPAVETAITDTEDDSMGSGLKRLPICGGNWNNGSNAGVFNVNLNNTRTNSNSNIGFRSALPSYAGIGTPTGYRQCEGIKELTSAPVECRRKTEPCRRYKRVRRQPRKPQIAEKVNAVKRGKYEKSRKMKHENQECF